MSSVALRVCEWVEATSLGVAVRESLWLFPALVAIHTIALVFSVGIVVWFDLRLLGTSFTRARVSDVYRQLMPWAFGGFVVMFASGSALLSGFATAAFNNMYFRAKIVAIVLAGVNAGVYHVVTERRIARWDESPRPALPARMAGMVSVALWTIVILAGRMVAYTLYSR